MLPRRIVLFENETGDSIGSAVSAPYKIAIHYNQILSIQVFGEGNFIFNLKGTNEEDEVVESGNANWSNMVSFSGPSDIEGAYSVPMWIRGEITGLGDSGEYATVILLVR